LPLNPLQARLDLQLGSGLQANVLNNEKSEVKDPIQLSISSTSEESSAQTLNDPVQIAIISSTSPENSLKSPLQLEISSNSTSSEESSNQSLIYENGVTERTNKGRGSESLASLEFLSWTFWGEEEEAILDQFDPCLSSL
jgi:hypothetical protein